MCVNTSCTGSCSSCCTDGASCPVGHVAIYDENQSFAGCVTPQEATIYNNDKVQCPAGYAKLIDPNSGEFLACMLVSSLASTLTALEAATLHVGLSYVNVTCSGDADGSATVAVSGGTAPYTITWTDDLGATVDPAILASGAYILTVADASGVTQVKYFNITEPDALGITAIYQNPTVNPITPQSDGKIQAFPVGGTAPYSYDWKEQGFSIGQTTQTATGLPAGDYGVTVTDANNCIINLSSIILT
jgi:hypothetical protein